MFYDPVITYGSVQDDIPSAQMVNYWKPMFSLNDTYLQDLNDRADKCGYTDFINTAMTKPATVTFTTHCSKKMWKMHRSKSAICAIRSASFSTITAV